VRVDVRTEAEDDGRHGIWFNRGVAGSQAFVKRFGQYTPPVGASEEHPAFAWLSRGLGEAFVRFAGRADGPEWGLRGAFYEFTWRTGLAALAAARDAGADVQLVVHGRDRDPAGRTATPPPPTTTPQSPRRAGDVVTWHDGEQKRVAAQQVLVLTRAGQPVAVWTGSMNITRGAVFRHLNVGHLIGDPAVAQRFLDYWAQLADQAGDGDTAAVDDRPTRSTSPPRASKRSSRRGRRPARCWTVRRRSTAGPRARTSPRLGLNKVFGSGSGSTGTSSVRCCSTKPDAGESRRSTRTCGSLRLLRK
jgi:hypothetical protein